MSMNRARTQAIAQSSQKTTIPEMPVAIQNAFGHRSGTLRILSSGRFRVNQMCRRSKASRGESRGQEGRWRRSHRRPFERRLIERSPDLVVEGRLWRRRRDRFWAVLGPGIEIERSQTKLLRAVEWAAAKRGGFAAWPDTEIPPELLKI